MKPVQVYTGPFCGYCRMAKQLLDRKGVPYDEIDVSGDDALREEMVRRSGRTTVPEIFIDGQPIGGYDELAALERAGELDALLADGDG